MCRMRVTLSNCDSWAQRIDQITIMLGRLWICNAIMQSCQASLDSTIIIIWPKNHICTGAAQRWLVWYLKELSPTTWSSTSPPSLSFSSSLSRSSLHWAARQWLVWDYDPTSITLITYICHRHHRRCLCKKFLSGVNFSRLSEKMHIFDFFRHIFSVFGAFSRFLGCKIWFLKILPV